MLDGHHSLVAAAIDGVEPIIVECTDRDTLYGLDVDQNAWLERHYHDSDWRYVGQDGMPGDLVW